jgi:hypothetical protein
MVARPDGPIEDPTVMGEVMFSGEPYSPQGSRGRAGGCPQQGSKEQPLGMEPNPVRKAWCEGGQHPNDRIW